MLIGGRTLLNGDTLQVTGVNDDGSLRVRRAVDADEATGQRRYASAFTLPAKHVRVAELAYAVRLTPPRAAPWPTAWL